MTIVGQYGAELQFGTGTVPLLSTPITVLTVPGGANATLYTDLSGSVGAANPVNTDTRGNLSFFAAPGQYDLKVGVVVYARVIVDIPGAAVGAIGGPAGPLDGAGLLPAGQTRPVVAGLNIINPMASPYNAVGDGSADDTIPLQNALTALHTSGGDLYLPSRSGFKLTGGLVVTKPDLVGIHGPASGQATLLPAFNGDCIRISMASFVAEKSAGTYGGFTIDGTSAGASACGIHIGDAMNGSLCDLRVQNFTGAGAKGIWCDNRTFYTERWNWQRVNAVNNSIGVLFDVNGSSSNSFGYQAMNRLHLVVNSGQVGIQAQAGALIYNSEIGISANLANGSTFWKIVGLTGMVPGVTAFADCMFFVHAEVTGGGAANGIQLSEFGGISGGGMIDLSSGTITSTNSITHPGAANLFGWMRIPGLIGVSQGTGTISASATAGAGAAVPANVATFEDRYVNGVHFKSALFLP